jgi:hypothetical protein
VSYVPKPKKVVERTVSKSTSRTGSATKRGGGRTGSGGAIIIASVSPSGNVGNPVPTVRAKVEAEEANLSKSDIRLYLDGADQRRFYLSQRRHLNFKPWLPDATEDSVSLVPQTLLGLA